MKLKYLVGIVLLVIVFIYYEKQQMPQQSSLGVATQISPTIRVGIQTKTADCVAKNGFPDTACTPGAVFPNVTKNDICQSGYAKSVRNVPLVEKHQVYQEYGITHHTAGEYEVDHLISLELGGSNEIANLWPEPAEPRPGFHEKDRLENFLHDQVCNGQISLQQAQKEIATDWLSVYKSVSQ